MSSLENIIITLPANWSDVSEENPDGPSTFINDLYEIPGVLQISTVKYLSGRVPNPSYEDLISLSESVGVSNTFGEVINKEYGNCSFGKFGSVIFSKPEFPYIAVWHLSDGKDFVFATFICSEGLKKGEIEDVKSILTSLKIKTA